MVLLVFSIQTFPEQGRFALPYSFVLFFRFFELLLFHLISLLYLLPLQICILNNDFFDPVWEAAREGGFSSFSVKSLAFFIYYSFFLG